MCHVLILDDDKYFAETIKMILVNSEEATPQVTTRREEAVEHVRLANKKGQPFEVFLIDQRLGLGKDGIEVMKELRQISPDTETIIFTGYDDTESGLRAYEAGAFRYLSKPFEPKELLYLLKYVKQWRKEQREHDWQKIFSSMMEEALSKESFGDVADIVIKYSLKLGFRRAHLFWVPTREDANHNNLMVPITCAGSGCIPDFTTNKRLYPIRRWFDLNRVKSSRDAIFLREQDAEKVQKQAEEYGFTWPVSENIILPLWSGTKLLGALMLDSADQERVLSEHERQLLNFFARQVSLALEKASLFIKEKRSREETAIIGAIGQQVTAKAAIENLTSLLEEVRNEVGRLINTSSFTVLLLDEDTNELDFHLHYQEGERLGGVRKPLNAGLEGYLMAHPEGLFLPSDCAKFIAKNAIHFEGNIPSSWMGVTLKVSDRVIGGIILQQFKEEEKFTPRDWDLLEAVANQIAGAIELSRINEMEKKDAERLNVLRRSSMEMLRVARKNEEHLWTLSIALATAHFGTGFNRALLFLANENHTALVLKSAVGTEDPLKAHHDWEWDDERAYQFDDFLHDLEHDSLSRTDFDSLCGKVIIPLEENATDLINEVMRTAYVTTVPETELASRMPPQLTDMVNLGECAIVPLTSGNRTIGLMVVDNKHNHMKLTGRPLFRLQTILNYAGLVWETLRQQKKSDNLLDANYAILGSASKDALKKTLKRICQTAREISEADWAIIYPLRQGEDGFDKNNISYDGILKYPLEEKVKDKPRKRGVSAHVLNHRELVVHNIHDDQTQIDAHRLAEHHFIQREGVQSLIGIAITQVTTDEPLGVLYLDYRKPRDFTEDEIHHARSFASLASVAIANARRFDQERQRKRLQAAQSTAEIVSKAIDLDDMLKKVLDNLRGLFKGSRMCVLTYETEINALRFVPATLKYYSTSHAKATEELIFSLSGPSIACRVARDSIRQKRSATCNEPDVSLSRDYLKLIPSSRSELCVGLVDSEKQLLGVLALERESTHGFSEEDEELVQTVAFQLSIGLERLNKNDELDYSNTVSALTAWAADIAHDIKSEVGLIKDSTYLIREFAGNNPAVLENLAEIEKSAEKLSQADPEKSKYKQPLPIDELLKRFGDELTQEKDLEVEYGLHAHNCYVNVNSLVFKRMLSHLCSNARRAMENKAEKKIKISSRKVDKKLIEIQFQDFGRGIPEHIRADILRKRTTTKKGIEGGGHGLLFSRQAVEEMGGKIRLMHSELEKGTTFAITLPIYSFPDTLPE